MEIRTTPQPRHPQHLAGRFQLRALASCMNRETSCPGRKLEETCKSVQDRLFQKILQLIQEEGGKKKKKLILWVFLFFVFCLFAFTRAASRGIWRFPG